MNKARRPSVDLTKDGSEPMNKTGQSLNHLRNLLIGIHLGLSRIEGIAPSEIVWNRLQLEAMTGLFWGDLTNEKEKR